MNKHSRNWFRAIGGRMLLTAGAGLALMAAQSPSAGDRPIVVQAERLTSQAARERALGFVRTTGVASGETPAARWIDPICPDVTGLVESAERAAEARIRRIAAAVGVRVAPENCVRNIVVSFTENGAGLAQAISRQEPRRLSELTPAGRDAVLTGSAPIRWWYTTEVRSRHGEQGGSGTAASRDGNAGPGDGAGSSLGGGGLMLYDSSVVSTQSQRVITSAIVIVDQDDIMGRRLDSLADYAALVALAEIRGVGATPEGSILNMFAGPNAARNLTAQDMAFLQALYRLNLDRQAMQHRGALIGQITDALTAVNP